MIIDGNDPYTQPSFSLANRWRRAAWGLAWLLLARWTPAPLHGWRALVLRAFGATLGRDVHIYPSVRIWAPWNLTVGNRVGVGPGATLYTMAHITLGDGVVVSQGAHLCAGTHDIDSGNFQLHAQPITVGAHAWLCAECFVGPGVQVAEGCVLGARGVAMRHVTPAWTVWSGNPAALRRERVPNAIHKANS